MGKPIKHNAETFKLFDTLGLEAPITVADVPPFLEKLDQQIVAVKEKVDTWEAQKEEMKQKILDGGSYADLVKGEETKRRRTMQLKRRNRRKRRRKRKRKRTRKKKRKRT